MDQCVVNDKFQALDRRSGSFGKLLDGLFVGGISLGRQVGKTSISVIQSVRVDGPGEIENEENHGI